jgi:uncharacterized protein YjbI with pentapeptide repeats
MGSPGWRFRAAIFPRHCSHADLSGSNLASARFGRADLSNVDVAKANLDYADFTGAHLPGANLRRASLIRQCSWERTSLALTCATQI